jgi:hypothetical protein
VFEQALGTAAALQRSLQLLMLRWTAPATTAPMLTLHPSLLMTFALTLLLDGLKRVSGFRAM